MTPNLTKGDIIKNVFVKISDKFDIFSRVKKAIHNEKSHKDKMNNNTCKYWQVYQFDREVYDYVVVLLQKELLPLVHSTCLYIMRAFTMPRTQAKGKLFFLIPMFHLLSQNCSYRYMYEIMVILDLGIKLHHILICFVLESTYDANWSASTININSKLLRNATDKHNKSLVPVY